MATLSKRTGLVDQNKCIGVKLEQKIDETDAKIRELNLSLCGSETTPTTTGTDIGGMTFKTTDNTTVTAEVNATNFQRTKDVPTTDTPDHELIDFKFAKAKFTQSAGLTIWTGTQAEYDAITTKDASTLYFIKEES